MQVQRASNQPAFSGKLSVITYNKVGNEVKKNVEEFVTTQIDDLCISLKASAASHFRQGQAKADKSASTILTELFEKLIGKKAPQNKGEKVLFTADNEVRFGDASPSETGGVIYHWQEFA